MVAGHGAPWLEGQVVRTAEVIRGVVPNPFTSRTVTPTGDSEYDGSGRMRGITMSEAPFPRPYATIRGPVARDGSARS